MKHDLTTGTWQDDTGCPISIILVSTSDAQSQRRRQSRTSIARLCPLIFSDGDEGEALTTTTIQPRRPPRRDRLRLQWRPKTIQRSGRGGDDDTIDSSKSNQQSTNNDNGKWRGGGTTGRRQDEGQGHAHNNQIDHAEGGVVDDNDDDDGHDNNDNNDDDGGCGGRDGHHRMRKGRRHDNRTNTTIK